MALELNGTTGVSLVQDGVVTQADLASGVGGKFVSYAVICDQKASGTVGGTFTSGDWRTRDLNTEIADPDGIVSISSNQFTLQAGTYLIKWQAPANYVNNHQSRLRNVTDSSGFLGTSAYSANLNADADNTISFGIARVTIPSSKVFEIQHQAAQTKNTNGFGVATSFGVVKYTIVEIFKEV